LNRLTEKIIGAAIEVHRHLGPGLLESAYETCLAYELEQLGLAVERQKALPLVYKEIRLDHGVIFISVFLCFLCESLCSYSVCRSREL